MELFLRRSDGEGGEREVTARLERTGPGRYRVELDGEAWEVDSAAVEDGLSSLRLGRPGESGARGHFEVSTTLAAAGSYRVASRHHVTDVEVMSPLEHLSREALGAEGVRGPEKVTAYMPGRVVAVLVEEGAEVEAGQGVVVLEAMKMENEILAEHPGTVRRLLVEPGQSVEAGEGLFELE